MQPQLLIFLCLVSTALGELKNVALGKPTLLSSHHHTYNDSSMAVDGNLATNNIFQCVHTDKRPGQKEWIMVDLEGTYEIRSVVIFNRGDCCGRRLRNFDIVVTEVQYEHPENSPSSTVCAYHKAALRNGENATFKCPDIMEGQFVYLVLLYEQFLHICEIQVMAYVEDETEKPACEDPEPGNHFTVGLMDDDLMDQYDVETMKNPVSPCLPSISPNDLRNVALYKPVALSSRYRHGFYTPEKAVDGSLRNYHISHCFHTSDGENQWFRVDLLGYYVVFSVIITNRGECCGDRLRQFRVLVTDTPFTKFTKNLEEITCVNHEAKVKQGDTEEMWCRYPIKGRFVTVVQLYDGIMHFCELQVMAKPALLTGNGFKNVALHKPVAVSSNYSWGYNTPWKAVDGDIHTNIQYCFHTNGGQNQWFRVDLEMEYLVFSVLITNRGDCCGDRLRQFKVLVTDSPFTNFENIPGEIICVDHKGEVTQGDTEEMRCPYLIQGRYVTVVQQYDGVMHFCELQVMAKPALPTYIGFKNVALHKPVAVSTNYSKGFNTPWKAVDGYFLNHIQYCFHTNGGPNQWFRVDLEKEYLVFSVWITNRGDCCGDHLREFKVLVTEDPPTNPEKVLGEQLCVYHKKPVLQGDTEEMQCQKPLKGRYVTVIQLQSETMHFCELQVMAKDVKDTFPPYMSYGLTNVALHKPVAVSTNYSKGYNTPWKAVDGDLRNNMKFCFHTNGGWNQWFRVDLLAKYRVFIVRITNRGDCCGDKLRNFIIVVTNEPSSQPQNSGPETLCVRHEAPVAQGNTEDILCDQPLVGRYVTLVLMGETVLHFCEIEVLAKPEVPCIPSITEGLSNVALLRPVAVSSIYRGGYNTPWKAVDGSLENKHISYCFHTDPGRDQWFRVDLQAEHIVHSVTITNRGECCGDRLKNFTIVVADKASDNPETSAPETICLHHKDPVPTNRTEEFVCQRPMVGRFVTVVLIGNRTILHFCEIQVWAKPIKACQDSDLKNQALGKPVAVSSNYPNGYNTPEKAVDGNQRNDHIQYCFHTDTGKNQWFRVDLLEQFIVFSVTITNRGDCCGDRLTNFKIVVANEITNSPERSTSEKVCVYHKDPVPTKDTVVLECEWPVVGRFVTVVLIGEETILHFCEIQVMARPASCQQSVTDNGGQNVALNKPVSISSTYRNGFDTPENAVDGDLRNDSQTYCFQTGFGMHQWFRVDLGEQHVVSAVMITNRGDSQIYDHRLKNFRVVVTEQPCASPETSSPETICQYREDPLPLGGTKELKCHQPLLGRYVAVVLMYHQSLGFCELQVIGKPISACLPIVAAQGLENVALNKPVEVKSNYSKGYRTPWKAVDGSLVNYHISKCFHTNGGPHQWFRVDLQDQYIVFSVRITNRGECCGDKLKNFNITVTDQPSSTPENSHPKNRCVEREHEIGQGETENLLCKQPLVGRYVTLVLRGDTVLHFCEMEVMGRSLVACFPPVDSNGGSSGAESSEPS